jgi:predicted RNase H-like nuclease
MAHPKVIRQNESSGRWLTRLSRMRIAKRYDVSDMVVGFGQVSKLRGIDGCRGGWVLAEASGDLQNLTFRVIDNLGAILSQSYEEYLTLIDIPIGIPMREPRVCDNAARELLGWPRRNSVFSPPARSVFKADNYADALRLNRETLRMGISKQAYCIMPKIREVDALMQPELQRRVREAHPEVTFASLNGGAMAHNKRSASGQAERIAVLERFGLKMSNSWLRKERERLGRNRVELDDLLDAVACLVTAFHVSTGGSRALGHPDQIDDRGLLMEIVTCVL